MATEHEGPERAAEEISQLLYHLQVLMLASGLTLDDISTPTSDRFPLDLSLRIAQVQQGLSGRASRRHAPAGRIQGPPGPQGSSSSPTPTTRSNSSTFDRVTSPSMSGPARSTPGSPVATCCSTRAAMPSRSWLSVSASRPSGMPPRGSVGNVADIAGQRVATSYPGLVQGHLAGAGVSAAVPCVSTEPSRRRSPSAWPTSSPMSWRRGRPCAARVWRSSATPSSRRKRCSSAVPRYPRTTASSAAASPARRRHCT